MTAPVYRRPSEVAERLGVSPSTLRRWSQQFEPFLSEAASASDDDSSKHRRYLEDDLDTLITIKDLLAEGCSYDQVRGQLLAERPGPEDDADVYAVVASSETAATALPLVAVIGDTLHTVADGQQLLLNSQQANRDLVSVAIQDNFNLKAENAQLRDRMLELERSLSEIIRRDADRREALETRLRALEDTISALVRQTEQQQNQSRRGFWARLLGS